MTTSPTPAPDTNSDLPPAPATRAARRAQQRAPGYTRTLLAVLALARDHLIDTGHPTTSGRWGRHIAPKHAALAATAAVSAVVLVALTFWFVDPTSTHTTNNDDAIRDLRTYERALDGSDSARTARDKIANRFVITDTDHATIIGRRSATTGQCWTLTVSKDATQATTITRGTDARCAPTAQPSTSRTAPREP